MSPRNANANVIAGLKCAEISPRKYTAATSQRADTVERTKAASHGRTGPPPWRARIAAPPDSTKVNPDIPMNSESNRRSLWSGFFQSAKYRSPPTLAASARSPRRTGAASELICTLLLIRILPQWFPARFGRRLEILDPAPPASLHRSRPHRVSPFSLDQRRDRIRLPSRNPVSGRRLSASGRYPWHSERSSTPCHSRSLVRVP